MKGFKNFISSRLFKVSINGPSQFNLTYMKNSLNLLSDLTIKDGIYFSKKISNISYPTEGSSEYFAVEDKSYWFNHRNNCILEVYKKYAEKSFFADVGGGMDLYQRLYKRSLI